MRIVLLWLVDNGGQHRRLAVLLGRLRFDLIVPVVWPFRGKLGRRQVLLSLKVAVSTSALRKPWQE